MPVELQTFFSAMLPLLELRAAIPVAILVYGMTPSSAYFWAVLGNIVPIFVILAFLEPVSLWLSRNFSFMKRFFQWLFKKTRKDYNKRIKKYGLFALFLFTAIPLPVSGAWTASLVVFLFGFPYLKSVVSIISGVLVAGLAVTLITEAGVSLETYYGPQILIGLLLLAILIYFIYYRIKQNVRTSAL